MRFFASACLIGIADLGMTPAVVHAQAAPEQPEVSLAEVVVTAQKRSENIQNVPISVSAVAATTLEDAHITNVSDLPLMVPALTISQNEDTLNIFMRGIGNPATTVGDEASVAVYIDGVYYPRLPQALLELNNIDHVEVLKGPQGTLFGRNATGGLIQIVTRDPSSTPTLHVDGGYGNYQTFTGNVYASDGFGENLAGDIALHDNHMGAGWGHNLYDGTNTNWADSKSARTKWVYKPTDGTKITLAYDYTQSATTQVLTGLQAPGYTHGAPCGATCLPFTPPNNTPYPYWGFYNSDDDSPSGSNDISQGGSLKLEQDVSIAKLVSISALRNQIGALYNDPDYSPQPWFGAVLAYKEHSFSQELQMISKESSPFDWTLGLYYMHMLSEYDPGRLTGAEYQEAFSLPQGQFEIYGAESLDSYAAYTQETFHVTSDTNLTAGLRYTEDRVSANGHNDITDQALGVDINTGNQSEHQNFDKITWRLALDHHFTDDLMSYISYNRGFKAGTFNIFPFSGSPNPPSPAVSPEVVDAFELGTKTDLLEHRLRASAALFYNKVGNLQVQTVRPIGDPPVEEVFLTNAAKARSYGLDLDLQALFTEQFAGHVSTTIQNPTYTSYPDAGKSIPVPGGVGTELTTYNASGQQLVYSPKYAVTLGVTYRLPTSVGEFGSGLDYAFTSGFPFNPDGDVNNGNVGLLSARVSFIPAGAGSHWKFLVWGKNLTDKQYLDGSEEQNNRTGEVVTPAAPRTYGFTVSYDF
jgi:iron complex outermembrane receptor protein